jgi:hypothetical protein
MQTGLRKNPLSITVAAAPAALGAALHGTFVEPADQDDGEQHDANCCANTERRYQPDAIGPWATQGEQRRQPRHDSGYDNHRPVSAAVVTWVAPNDQPDRGQGGGGSAAPEKAPAERRAVDHHALNIGRAAQGFKSNHGERGQFVGKRLSCFRRGLEPTAPGANGVVRGPR